jgi:hypothetical protein
MVQLQNAITALGKLPVVGHEKGSQPMGLMKFTQ